MTIKVDLHTHTLASDHAYSTLFENLTIAKEKGLEAIGMTDHAPEIEDAPHDWHFFNMKILPRVVNGVTLLRGIECTVKEKNGRVDYPERFGGSIDYAIASLHFGASPNGTPEEITEIWKNVAKNPLVDIIGHCGDMRHPFIHEEAILAFRDAGKLVELNNSSMIAREGSLKNFYEIAKVCKQYKVPVVVNSDCHFCCHVGEVSLAEKFLTDIDFPEELIINTSLERVIDYFKDRGRDLIK